MVPIPSSNRTWLTVPGDHHRLIDSCAGFQRDPGTEREPRRPESQRWIMCRHVVERRREVRDFADAFTSGQYLTISNPVVAGKTAASSRTNSNGIYTYTITYLIRPNDISYNGEVGFSLGISKGGETQTITQEDCTSAARVRYELPFKVSGFSIISTNAANGQAATQADSVIVSFVTSADVHVNDSSIAGVGQSDSI